MGPALLSAFLVCTELQSQTGSIRIRACLMLGLAPLGGSILDPAGLEEPQHPPRAASAALLQHQHHPLTAQHQSCLQHPNPQQTPSERAQGAAAAPFPCWACASPARRMSRDCIPVLPAVVGNSLFHSRCCSSSSSWQCLGLDLHRFLKGSVLFPSFSPLFPSLSVCRGRTWLAEGVWDPLVAGCDNGSEDARVRQELKQGRELLPAG